MLHNIAQQCNTLFGFRAVAEMKNLATAPRLAPKRYAWSTLAFDIAQRTQRFVNVTCVQLRKNKLQPHTHNTVT